MGVIASSVPGRLRIRSIALQDLSVIRDLESDLDSLDGVMDLVANVRASSVTVRYDPAVLSKEALETVVLGRLEIDTSPSVARISSLSSQRRWRQIANRYAKYGAIAAMGVSLLAIVAKRKRLHTQAGILALALTGVHMYVHRRHLWR